MPAPIPVKGLTLVSLALTAIVVGNAFYQKKQFYPSVVYITKSNTSMAAIYFLAFILVILFGKLLKKVFFGQLRTAEFEQLIERSFYAITETCLAFTVFRDDFSPKFVALFTVLLFIKAFHYLTDSRVDFMERSPIITVIFHLRVASLLLFLLFLDIFLLNHSYQSTIAHGATVQLAFGFEYAILLTVGLNIAIKYLCHSIDRRLENPWDNKAVYLLYTELLVEFVKVILYGIFLFIMIRIHTFPLFIIRPMYLTLRSFKNTLNYVVQSRRAIHNMNTLYPEATPEELSAVDNVCIICREEMVTGAKKLPCGHIFHSSCLRSWFQRQQTCPTCRMDILRQTMPTQPQQAPRPAQGQPQAAPQPPQPQPPQPNVNAQQQQQQNLRFINPFAQLFPAARRDGLQPPFPFAPFQLNQLQQQFQQQQQQEQASTSPQTSSQARDSPLMQNGVSSSSPPLNTFVPQPNIGQNSSSVPISSPAGIPLSGIPPFLPFMPFSIPFPMPPPNFEGLTLEELESMEGRERNHVESRIKTLRNIQTLLDAAVFQLSQYNSIMNRLEAEASVLRQSAEERDPNHSDTCDKKEDLKTEKSESDKLNSSCVEGATALLSDDKSTEESSVEKNSPDRVLEPDPESPQEIRRRRLEKIYGKDSAETISPS